jgi:GDSL-like Lipase/Acylhydrolase family
VFWVLVGALGLLGLAAVIAAALRRRVRQGVLGAVLVAIAVLLAQQHVTRTPDPAPLDPNPSSAFKIVALGDSYLSGEGASQYFEGTDEPGGSRRNLCHRASTVHPYLAAEDLDASLTFVACSGARTADVMRSPQYPHSPDDVYGGKPQIEVLKRIADADAVLLSIGGNDAGFAEIGADCAVPGKPDCRRAASYWLRQLESTVYPALVSTYKAVRRAAHGAPVFAMTYPNPLGPEFCPDLVGLDEAEMSFVRDVFSPRLNEIVESAAAAARVRAIDLESAVDGYRFCEKPLGETAVNFIELEHTVGAPIDVFHPGDIAHGTLHPNRLGHERLERRVLPELRALREGRLKPLPPVPGADERPPPLPIEEVDLPPPGAPQFPPGTDCHGEGVAVISRLSAEPEASSMALSEVRPGSTVCFRTYRGKWHSRHADPAGAVRVPIDVSNAGVASINEVLVERADRSWNRLVVSRLGDADEGGEPEEPSKLGLYLLLAAVAVALLAVLAILVKFSSAAGD